MKYHRIVPFGTVLAILIYDSNTFTLTPENSDGKSEWGHTAAAGKYQDGSNEHHGYFNHNDGTYLNGLESLVKTMIKAVTSTDTNYTLESIYNSAPK